MTQQTVETAGPVAQAPVPGLPVSDALAGDYLLTNYRNTQQQIATRAATAIDNLWNRMIDPERFSDTWTAYNPVVNGIIDVNHGMTAANAAQYYSLSSTVNGNPYYAVPGVNLDQDYLNRETNMMGPGQFYHFVNGGNDPVTASGMARDALRGAGTRLIMNGGRQTVTQAASLDDLAEGWERVIEPGACSFCAMLAGRGAVYKGSTVNFRAHDHCHCVARAIFKGQESINGDLSDQWAQATKGKRGKNARAAWESHWSSHNVEPKLSTAEEPKTARPGNAAITGKRK